VKVCAFSPLSFARSLVGAFTRTGLKNAAQYNGLTGTVL
jgi:hypothetical protein